MQLKSIFFIIVIIFCISCRRGTVPDGQALVVKANKLAQENIIVDGHVDLPFRLKIKNFKMDREYLGIPLETKEGDFDFKRARQGGLDAPFMSIYIPSDRDSIESKRLADTLISMVNYIAQENKDFFAVCTSPQEVSIAKKEGKIALPMGMENGSPITKISDVAMYRKKGISYVTLTHAKDNQICDSSYDTTHTWNGLSAFGQEVVYELARQGIMIDISHVSDASFFDVSEISPVPLLASHSSARHFTPGFERNMSDDIIMKMGENGGVIMINFGSTFLDGEVAKIRNEHRDLLNAIYEEKGIDEESEEAELIRKEFYTDHPALYADVEKVADHIDYIKKMIGIDHIGLGSDFDGVGDSLPTGLKDVSDYPNLILALLKRGYADTDIEKICYKNVFRVWQKTIDYSHQQLQK